MDFSPNLDDTDRRLLEIVMDDPRVGVREFSRRLAVARGTAQARLDKLEARGVLASWAPTLDPSALGYPLGALVHIQMAQATAIRLSRIEMIAGSIVILPSLAVTLAGLLREPRLRDTRS